MQHLLPWATGKTGASIGAHQMLHRHTQAPTDQIILERRRCLMLCPLRSTIMRESTTTKGSPHMDLMAMARMEVLSQSSGMSRLEGTRGSRIRQCSHSKAIPVLLRISKLVHGCFLDHFTRTYAPHTITWLMLFRKPSNCTNLGLCLYATTCYSRGALLTIRRKNITFRCS